jgi:hypothetical protein
MNMEYPFGFEEQKGAADIHPTHQELQTYCERSLSSSAEIGHDEFMKVESHLCECDSCRLVLTNARITFLENQPDAILRKFGW